MNQDIKQRWVAALRSGEYEQGKDALREDNKFCCLGVLCELAVQDGVIQPGVTGEYDWASSTTYLYDHNSGHLPVAVSEWAGLSRFDEWSDEDTPEADPLVEIDGAHKCLSELNDEGVSFAELADIIEEKL